MITIVLQIVHTTLMCVFGRVALAVARRSTAFPGVQNAAWQWTGFAFTVAGATAAVQTVVWAPWAFFSGPTSAVYTAYLRWAPVGNHGRHFLIIALGTLLIGLNYIRSTPGNRLLPLVFGVLLLGMVIGGWIGWWEGSLTPEKHYNAVAAYNTLQLLVLLVALFGAFLFHTMDRHLWIALVVYTLHEAWNAIWFSALAWIEVSGAWSPKPWQIQFYAVLAYAVMIFFAARRLRLAHRGVRVPALLEPLEPKPASVMGWDQ